MCVHIVHEAFHVPAGVSPQPTNHNLLKGFVNQAIQRFLDVAGGEVDP